MERIQLSSRQLIFLMVMIMPVNGHLILTPRILDLAGKDGWISLILSLIPALFLIGFLSILHYRLPQQDLPAIIDTLGGKWLGKVFLLGYAAFFIMLSFITLRGVANNVESFFFPETPPWFICLLYVLSSLYVAWLGVEVKGRMAEALFIVLFISGWIIFFLLIPEKDYSRLLPVLEEGWSPPFKGSLIFAVLWGELVVYSALNLQKDKPNTRFKHLLLILGLVTMINVSTLISPIAIYGETFAQTLISPTISMVREVNIGELERVDVYAIFLLTLGGIVRIGLYQYMSSVFLSRVLTVRNYRIVLPFMAPVVFFTPLLAFKGFVSFKAFMIDYYPYLMIIPYGLTFVLVVLSLFRVKKQKC